MGQSSLGKGSKDRGPVEGQHRRVEAGALYQGTPEVRPAGGRKSLVIWGLVGQVEDSGLCRRSQKEGW